MSKNIKYVLSTNDLETGKLYECENKTIVILLSSGCFNPIDDTNSLVVNIQNGVGSYNKEHKFRTLSIVYVETETDLRGKIQEINIIEHD